MSIFYLDGILAGILALLRPLELTQFGQLGLIGLSLALIVFFYFWYKANEKLLAKKDKAYQELTKEVILVVQENTKSSVKLTNAVNAVKDAIDKNSDVLSRIEHRILINRKEKEDGQESGGSKKR